MTDRVTVTLGRRVAELEEQVVKLLELIEGTGQKLSEVDELFDKWNVPKKDMRQVIKLHASLGEAMVRAAERTRKRLGIPDA